MTVGEPSAAARAIRAPALVGCALVAASAVAAYASSVSNGFVWDDAVVVGAARTSTLAAAFFSPDEVASYYRPLTRASFVLDFRLFGSDPRWFHAVGVLVHAANAVLLFLFGRRLFRSVAPAIVAAVLFAVHPVCSEAVDFVSARNNLLALFFSLAALVLFADARDRLSAAAFLLGLLSKEPAVMVLPVLAIWSVKEGPRLRRLAPHLAALAVYVVLRVVSVGVTGPAPPATRSLGARLADDLTIVPGYLGLTVFPRELTIFHTVPPPSGWTVAGWAALALAAWAIARRPGAASLLGASWFALGLLPIANLVPIPSAPMAERYFYAPAAGLFLVIASFAERLRARAPRAAALCVAAVALALAARTIARNRDWRDDLSLARSAVQTDPSSAQARFNLGVVLEDAGDREGARAQWRKALELSPGDPDALTQLGTDAATRGDFASAEASYRRALASPAAPPLAYYDLALLCEKTGRPAEARVHYREFLERARAAYGMAQFAEFAQRRIRELESAR
jgi:protein O-mannosyl-transferase